MLQDAPPTEIAGKVFCGNPIESLHPLLESAVVGVDVLDMKQGLFFVDELVRRNQLVGDALAVHESPQGVATINAHNVFLRDHTTDEQFDGFGRKVRQNPVRGAAKTVTGHQNGDLLTGNTSLGGLSAPFPGGAAQFATPLPGFQNVCFICFCDSVKFRWLIGCSRLEEAMPPAKGRGHCNAAVFGARADAFAIMQSFGVGNPLVLFPEIGQGCPSERIESFAAFKATISLETKRSPPFFDFA